MECQDLSKLLAIATLTLVLLLGISNTDKYSVICIVNLTVLGGTTYI